MSPRASNARLVTSVLMIIAVSLSSGNENDHAVEKRQVGVLARSGALPQGKRSVEALARNGELPAAGNDSREMVDGYVLDQLIRELGTAEGLSRLRVQALAERLREDGQYPGKRSVASLARNAQLPQKRDLPEGSGYPVRPPHEASDEEPDLLDPDDFLGKGGVGVLDVNGGFNAADDSLAPFAKHGYGDNGEDFAGYFANDLDYSIVDEEEDGGMDGEQKRNLASFRNFGKRHVGAARNFLLTDKRNVASFKNFISNYEKRNLGAARNFIYGKRNVGAAKNFFSGAKKNVGSARDFLYGKRNLASFARDGGFHTMRYPSAKDYDWDDFVDFDDFHENEEKRNLGSYKNFGKRSVESKSQRSSGVPSATEQKMHEAGNNGNRTRSKRSAYLDSSTDEYPMPVLQVSRGLDYGDLDSFADDSDVQKRFMGSEVSRPQDQRLSGISKRHIGALARLGWLPSFRTTRYSRSGRAIDSRNIAPFRPNPSIGSCPSENSIPVWSSPPSAETKVVISRGGIFRRVGRSTGNIEDHTVSEPPKRYS